MKKELSWLNGSVQNYEMKDTKLSKLKIYDLLVNEEIPTVALYVNDIHIGFYCLAPLTNEIVFIVDDDLLGDN